MNSHLEVAELAACRVRSERRVANAITARGLLIQAELNSSSMGPDEAVQENHRLGRLRT